MEIRDTIPTLRGSLDSNDTFVSGGHRIMKTAGATRHAERMRKIPVWALDDQKIKQLVDSRYPEARTDHEQRTMAARLVRVIYLYYRTGETSASVGEQIGMTCNAVKCLIKRVNKAMAKPSLLPRGRPKKPDPIDGTSEPRF